MSGYPFALILAVATVLLIGWLLRTRRLREKYAFLWLALAVGICALGAFPRALFAVAVFSGVETPVNVLFSGAIVVLLLVAVQLSAELSQLEEEMRTVAESVALLQVRVDELERNGRRAGNGEAPEDVDEAPGQASL
ncbi:DUF2304 domain-containing protein [Rhodococcus antarcticus]|uniref:DUF2304 domain-containing protein n=1 Tax=Rhodococcus antarcticus TaxID=2987751 RepID=A0ABY6NYV3_9NOCA|nr:DUF2304 domain-containing protein [Rhodococcus antarcticus]UZJ24570.1 DUF2304 domain-containing protein [Rhodococcus antarcticus]